MRLLAGARAPECSFVTLRGEDVALEALRGGPIWLSFSRFAACPLCNYRLHQVIGEWERRFAPTGLRHFAFFQSPPEKLRDYVEVQRPPFDLVADPTMEVYRTFRVEQSLAKTFALAALPVAVAAVREGFVIPAGPDGPITRVPADFLIDGEGVIRVARYGESIVDHIPLDRVAEFARVYGRG